MTGNEVDLPKTVTMPTYDSLTSALQATLIELDLGPKDQAAAALAWRLALFIDHERSGRTLSELAAKMLSVLESLGATPAARHAILKEVAPNDVGDQHDELDELRSRHDRRAYGAAAVDPATS